MTRLQKLIDKRVKAIADARALRDRADTESRVLSPEEEQRWNAFMKEAEDTNAEIDKESRMLDAEAASLGSGREFRADVEDDAALSTRDNGDPAHHPQRLVLQKPEEIQAMRRALRGGMGALDASQVEVLQRAGMLDTDLERRAVERFFRGGINNLKPDELAVLSGGEQRGLQAGSDPSGGYLVMPQTFVNDLIKAVDDQTFIRQLATKYTIPNSESLGAPSLDTDVADADWTAEATVAAEDTALAFGKRELRPHDLSKLIKITRKLVRLVPNIEAFVRSRMAYKFGITFEKACLTGDGVRKPLGLFTASSDGISTGRDVSTSNTSTAVTADGIKSAKYTLKGAYWSRARWLWHRDAMAQIAKLKAGDGHYLWQPSIQAGQPDQLEGLPVLMSEYVPNTFTAGLYVGMVGDFSHYWIADATTLAVQVLYELYALTNNIGYIGRMASDGMPVLEEAFVRVKLGA